MPAVVMNKGTCEFDGVALAVLASERSEMDAKGRPSAICDC